MEELATDDDYIDWVQTAANSPFRPWFVLTPASRLRANCSSWSSLTETATICSTCRGTPGSTVLRSAWRWTTSTSNTNIDVDVSGQWNLNLSIFCILFLKNSLPQFQTVVVSRRTVNCASQSSSILFLLLGPHVHGDEDDVLSPNRGSSTPRQWCLPSLHKDRTGERIIQLKSIFDRFSCVN